MSITKKYTTHFVILWLLLLFFLLVNLSLGSVSIPLIDIFYILTGSEPLKNSWETIVLNYRLPKALTAVLVGSGLSVSGLLMQTLFRNPLAGPFVLGISSGASLGVALFMLGSGLFGGLSYYYIFASWSKALAAGIGAFLVLLAVIFVANKLRNTMSVLLVGLMFSSFTSAMISVLSYFSEATQIKQYQFWNFGSFGNLTWREVLIFTLIYLLAISSTFVAIKPLNSLLLGESYAVSLGINIKKSRNIILIITSLLTGAITAFSGPIAFVGIAVPHLAKIVFSSSNHKVLLPASALIGAICLLICDNIAQLPNSEFILPINAVTSILGAPVVIWLLVVKRNIYV
ncbi:MAG: iron chelate uptake ABC transporter family permease subunit [Tenacibaculum sp.]